MNIDIGKKSENSNKQNNLTGEWRTPAALFEKLNKVHHFTIDVCASAASAKCTRYFSLVDNNDDGLKKSWEGEVVFCNPPSGKKNLYNWVQKSSNEVYNSRNTKVVLLLPVSTDSRWFHEFILGHRGVKVQFLNQRVAFENPVVPSWVGNGSSNGEAKSTRPSMIVIMENNRKKFEVTAF